MALGILFPFKNTQEGGVFKSTNTSQESIRSNLISLLTTKRKQRPMRNKFYSPYYDFLFEQFDEISDASLKEELVEKIEEFFPDITLTKIENIFNEETHVLSSKIIYTIPSIGNITDEVNLNLSTEI